MLLSTIFGSAAASGGGAYPLIFPVLFGTGKNGVVNFANVADVGYMGSFGAPQYTNATLPAGVTLTVAPGSSNGGLLMACSGTLTLSGTITANGANGGAATAAASGAGGGTAGGGAGGAAVTSSSPTTANGSAVGPAPTQNGHGALPNTSRGGSAGVYIGEQSPVAFYPSNVAVDTNPAPGWGTFDFTRGVRASYPSSAASTAVTGSITAPTTIAQSRSIPQAALYPGNVFQSFQCLPSGLAGMGGPANCGQSGYGAGGGGGGGGGLVYIEANTIVFNAGHLIQANGGNGGAALCLQSGDGMGGMGGDGGLIVLVAQSFVGTPNVAVNGGTSAATAPASGPFYPTPTALSSLAGRVLLIQA
jgi:hypothetical protein